MHYHSFMFSVMCKCSYIINEDDTNRRRNRVVLPASASSSQGTTPTNTISPSSSASQGEVSTTFISSPRSHSQSSRRSHARSTARDEARSGGSTPRRLILPQLKRGKLKRRVTIGNSTSSGSADVDEPDWPPFSDEDYIVFCFEEDGAFHVILEESPRTVNPSKLQCKDHGNVTCACTDENKDVKHLGCTSRRDCLLPNKERKEEEMGSGESSPKLHLHLDRTEDSDLLPKDKIVLRNESNASMDCRNGSVESTDSSQLDWEEPVQHGINPEIRSIPPPRNSSGEDDNENDAAPAFWRDYFLTRKSVDEEEIFLSPKSQLGMMLKINSLLDDDSEGSSTVSDELCESNGSDTKTDHDEQLEENEPTSESAKSSVSDQSVSSSSSFEFPVLDCEWVGSPVTWPRPGRLQFKKHKSRRVCFRCCRF